MFRVCVSSELRSIRKDGMLNDTFCFCGSSLYSRRVSLVETQLRRARYLNHVTASVCEKAVAPDIIQGMLVKEVYSKGKSLCSKTLTSVKIPTWCGWDSIFDDKDAPEKIV